MKCFWTSPLLMFEVGKEAGVVDRVESYKVKLVMVLWDWMVEWLILAEELRAGSVAV